jgi:hypothetical protein
VSYRSLPGSLTDVGDRFQTVASRYSSVFEKLHLLWPLVVALASVFLSYQLFEQGTLYVSDYGDSSAYAGYFSPPLLFETLKGYQSGYPLTLSVLSFFTKDITTIQSYLVAVSFISAFMTCYALRPIVGSIVSAICAIALNCSVLNIIGMNNLLTEVLSYQLSVIVLMGTLALAQNGKISIWAVAAFSLFCVYFNETRSSNIPVVIIAFALIMLAHRKSAGNLAKLAGGMVVVVSIYAVHLGTVGNLNQAGNNIQRVLAAAGVSSEDAKYFKNAGFDSLSEHLSASIALRNALKAESGARRSMLICAGSRSTSLRIDRV